LHDTVEDTGVELAELRRVFDDDVATLVEWLTDVSRPEDGNRVARKAIDRAHTARAPARAKTVKLADLIDNSRSIWSTTTSLRGCTWRRRGCCSGCCGRAGAEFPVSVAVLVDAHREADIANRKALKVARRVAAKVDAGKAGTDEDEALVRAASTASQRTKALVEAIMREAAFHSELLRRAILKSKSGKVTRQRKVARKKSALLPLSGGRASAPSSIRN
jgi:hypothetical protein